LCASNRLFGQVRAPPFLSLSYLHGLLFGGPEERLVQGRAWWASARAAVYAASVALLLVPCWLARGALAP
jgi:hypothetical protein